MIRRGKLLLNLAKVDWTSGNKIASYIWQHKDKPGRVRVRIYEEFEKELRSRWSEVRTVLGAEDVTRIVQGVVKGGGRLGDVMMVELGRAMFRNKKATVSNICSLTTSMAAMVCRDQKLSNLIHAKVIRPDTPGNVTVRRPSDLIFISSMLLSCGHTLTLQSLTHRLSSNPHWAATTSSKDLAALASHAATARRWPAHIARQCFEGFMKSHCKTPAKPITIAYMIRALCMIYEAEEDRAFTIPILIEAFISSREVVDGTIPIFTLLVAVYGLGKGKMPLSVGEPILSMFLVRVDEVFSMPTSSKVKLLYSMAGMVSREVSEEPSLPEKYTDLVVGLAEELTSADVGFDLKIGDVSSILWSFCKLKYDNQYHLQSIAACLRERGELVAGAAEHNISQIVHALGKLRMVEDHDLLTACFARLDEITKQNKIVAESTVTNCFQTLGVFSPTFSETTRHAHAKSLLRLLHHDNYKNLNTHTATRIGWCLSRLEVYPGPQISSRITSTITTHFTHFNDYEQNQAETWLAFARKSEAAVASALERRKATPKQIQPPLGVLSEGFADISNKRRS